MSIASKQQANQVGENVAVQLRKVEMSNERISQPARYSFKNRITCMQHALFWIREVRKFMSYTLSNMHFVFSPSLR